MSVIPASSQSQPPGSSGAVPAPPQSPTSSSGNPMGQALTSTGGGDIAERLASAYKDTIGPLLAKEDKVADEMAEDSRTAMSRLPPRPQPQQTNPFQGWGGIAMGLAAVGGLLTRQPITVALNAGAGVMKAIKAGDSEQYQQQVDAWKDATDLAMKQHEFTQDAYKDIMAKYKTNTDAANAELIAMSSALKDDRMQSLAEQGKNIEVQRLYMERQRLGSELQKQNDELSSKSSAVHDQLAIGQAMRALAKAKQAGDTTGMQAAQDQIDDLKDKLQAHLWKLDPAKAADLTFGKASSGSPDALWATKWWQEHPDATAEDFGKAQQEHKGGQFDEKSGALMAALAERGVSLPTGLRSKDQQAALYKGLSERNPGKSPDEIADGIATGQIEFGAQKKETQTAAAAAGKVEVAQNELERFIPLVRDASKKVDRGSWVPLTRLMQTADSALSDPNLRALKIRINSVLNAYDQLAARGGTDQAKRQEVRDLITSADSPEVLDAALDSFEMEAKAAHDAAVEATRVPELNRRGGSGEASSAKSLPVPAQHDSDPDGTVYKGSDGKSYVKRGNQMVPQ